MADFLGSVWWMIVSLGVLVTFHEFGHFWVARRCDIKVLRFSVGFGKPLWSRRDRNGTEFAIAAIPLGGYVKMLDEREVHVPAAEQHLAFNNKSVWQRIAVVAAGPLANLVLCVALLWAMFVIGRQDYSATVGQLQGLAAQAGLQPGDRIVRAGDRAVATWSDAAMEMTNAALDHRDLPLTVETPDGIEGRHVLALSRLPDGFDERQVSTLAGLTWKFWTAPTLIGEVAPGGPADGVLQKGDRLLAIDGKPVDSAAQVSTLVQALGGQPGGMIEIERDGERLALQATPRRSTDPARKNAWELGIAVASQAPAYDAAQKYGPLAAIPAALRETGKLASDSLGMMRRLVTGQASLKNVSGPVTIARVANASAKRGADWFLYFLALLSLSLAIINLLPIPVLDGGHLLYYLIELVKGSPLSERAMAAGQYVGLALLAGLMGLAFYNDILGLLPQ